MSNKNFFEFNFESLKFFLSQDLQIEDKKILMRSKQIWQSVYKTGSFQINNRLIYNFMIYLNCNKLRKATNH